MGTQFSSRLTTSDAHRIVAGIQAARRAVVEPSRPAGKKRAVVGALSSTQQRKLGNATVAQVLLVAETHDFSSDFQKSDLFIQVLDWLKGLFTDAKFNGFEGVIDEYNLSNSRNPVPEFTRRLRELTTADEERKRDPFRVPVSNAARSVLADAASRQPGVQTGESPAKSFGRGLSLLHLKDLVDRYIRVFINDFLTSLMSRADPNQTEKAVQEAIELTSRTAERISKAIVKRVIDEGQIHESNRVREIVFEELHKIMEFH